MTTLRTYEQSESDESQNEYEPMETPEPPEIPAPFGKRLSVYDKLDDDKLEELRGIAESNWRAREMFLFLKELKKDGIELSQKELGYELGFGGSTLKNSADALSSAYVIEIVRKQRGNSRITVYRTLDNEMADKFAELVGEHSP